MTRQDMRRRDGLATFWAAFLGLCLVGALAVVRTAKAEGNRSTIATPDRSWYYSDSAVAVGTGATAVDFTAATGASQRGAFAVLIYNDAAATDLLVKFIPAGTSVSASQLTTPANKTGTDVQRITPADSPVPFSGDFAGLIWQSVGTATVAARLRVVY